MSSFEAFPEAAFHKVLKQKL